MVSGVEELVTRAENHCTAMQVSQTFLVVVTLKVTNTIASSDFLLGVLSISVKSLAATKWL